MNKTERNITLDYFKIGLSILVITIHFPIVPLTFLDDIYNNFISNGISRIAVPCFFIINGYFLKIDDFKKVKKYLILIFLLYVVWALFYLPDYNIYVIRSMLATFILGYKHLWYLPALLEAVIFIFILKKIIKNNFALFSIAITLFIVGYIVQLNTEESLFSLVKYRNFLFIGVPFLLLGHLLKTYKSWSIGKINTYFLILISIIFILEIYLSYKYLGIYEIYLTLFIICPLIYIYIIKHSRFSNNVTDLSQLSSAIYFSHMLILNIFTAKYTSTIYALPFVILMAILFSYLIIYANKSLKIYL